MLARRRQEHDKAEDLRRALERRLRLRRLNQDPVLSHDRSACSTRSAHISQLLPSAAILPDSAVFPSFLCITLTMPGCSDPRLHA